MTLRNDVAALEAERDPLRAQPAKRHAGESGRPRGPRRCPSRGHPHESRRPGQSGREALSRGREPALAAPAAARVLAAFQGGLWVIIAARSVACAPGPQPALRFDRGHLLNPAPTVAAEGARPGRPLWISAEPRIPPRPLRAQQRADGACAARKLHSPSRRPSIA